VSRQPAAPARQRRADARRSRTAVLDAAVDVLGERADASLDQIATAAGVTRQTVYAHFGSRAELIEAVVARMSEETVAMIDAAELEADTASEALRRFLDGCWTLMRERPVLLSGALVSETDVQDRSRHAPITRRLEDLLRRGQAAGEFDDRADPAWLTTAVLALGHAAGAEVTAGRMPAARAAEAMAGSVMRLVRAPD
jgi:AcrR family transcriptional regulator